MKSILISIRPEWIAKILKGEKTIEIRKTAPKCDLPIDVYIYCTKNRPFVQEEFDDVDLSGRWDYPTGHYVTHYKEAKTRQYDKPLNGKVVAKFRLNEIYEYQIQDANTWNDSGFEETAKTLMGLSLNELQSYADGKPFFGWVISDLEILDEPIGLKRFRRTVPDNGKHSPCFRCKRFGSGCDSCDLERAPQSWQYVGVGE